MVCLFHSDLGLLSFRSFLDDTDTTSKKNKHVLSSVRDARRAHLFEERHGKLLVRDAVLGRADVLLGLVGDVEVNAHQNVLL